MRIIYYSYWGTYAAYLMAALHTGIYPADSLPSPELIARQLELCKRYRSEYGNLLYVGMDEEFREVYAVGCKQHGAMVVRAITSIDSVFDIKEPVSFINAKDYEGIIPTLLNYSFGKTNSSLQLKLFTYWLRQKYGDSSQQLRSQMPDTESP